MSPIEARDYGVIDHIIGGDEAVFRNKAAAVKAAAAAKLVRCLLCGFRGRDSGSRRGGRVEGLARTRACVRARARVLAFGGVGDARSGALRHPTADSQLQLYSQFLNPRRRA